MPASLKSAAQAAARRGQPLAGIVEKLVKLSQ